MRRLTAIRERALWCSRIYDSESMNGVQIWQLLWPLLLDQFFMRILGILNTTMISSYGPEAVSAVSVIESLNMFLTNFFFAIATGCTVVVAQYCGRNERRTAMEAAAQAVSVSVLTAVLVSGIICVFPAPIINLLFGEADPLMREYAENYMLGSAVSYPFFALIQTILGAMRGSSDAKPAVVYSTALNLLNLLGNALFLSVFRFGVFGLSLAVVLSRAIITVPAILYLARREGGICAKAFFRLNLGLQRSIIYIAAPTGLEQVFFHAGRILTQVFIVGYGTMSAAANAITLPFSFIIQTAGMTIQTGIVTIVGRCIGAGDIKAAKRYIKIMTVTGFAASLLLSLIFAPILPWFLSIYNLPQEAYGIAFTTSILILAGIPFTWPGSFIIASGLRAAGDAAYTSIVSLICMWAVRVGLGYYLGTTLGYGLHGIWIAMFLEWIVRSIIFALRAKGDKWTRHKVI